MPRRAGRPLGVATWATLVLLGVLAVAGADEVRRTAYTTADETGHLDSARNVRFGEGRVSNLDKAVLLKFVAGLGLRPVKPPRQVDETRDGRRAFPVFLGILVIVTGAWVALRSGPGPGIAIASLIALEPSFRGHAALVQTDILLTLFFVTAAGALDLGSRRGRVSGGLLFTSGLAYGFALLAKFSAVAFLPVYLAVAFVAVRRALPGEGGSGMARSRRATWIVARFVLLPAALVPIVLQELAYAGVPRTQMRAAAVEQFRHQRIDGSPALLAEALPNGAAAYGLGLWWARIESAPGKRLNYFFGRVSGKGWTLYFPLALAVKLTTATVLAASATGIGLIVALARARPLRRRHLMGLCAARGVTAAVLGLAYLALAALSDVNIGVRHALPVAALLFVVAAAVASTLLRRRPLVLGLLLGVTVAGALAEAGAYRGREISFGNFLAGGPSGLRRILSDSNVEWGQEQGLLYERIRRGGLGRVGYVAFFVDGDELKAAGAAGSVFKADDPSVDVVFVSTFLWDLGKALARCDERYPKLRYFKSWLSPLIEGLERRADRIEPLGDGYLLLRLRHADLPSTP